MRHKAPEGLTAGEFFAKGLDGCTMTAAHVATGISYSSINDIAKGTTKTPRRDNIVALQEWSLRAGGPHGFYISAIKTLGLEEPTAKVAAGGR